MDGEIFSEEKPPKTFSEKVERMQKKATQESGNFSRNLDRFTADMIDKAAEFSIKVEQQGS